MLGTPAECLGPDSVRICRADSEDSRTCGVPELVFCEQGSVCEDGACVTEDCPPVGVECTPGDRICSADEQLLECTTRPDADGSMCARYEAVEDCTATGGICDVYLTRAWCIVPDCETEFERRCLDDEQFQECESVGERALQWGPVEQCSSYEVCQDDDCVCAEEPGRTGCDVGTLACAPDGKSIEQCIARGECTAFTRMETCATNEVCSTGETGELECIYPVEDTQNPPVVGGGCSTRNARSCTGDSTALECRSSLGGSSVWEALSSPCDDPSVESVCSVLGPVECRSITSAQGDTCRVPEQNLCPGSTTCVDLGNGTTECS